MVLFTGKGDDGSTGFFGCTDRFSKNSARAKALGTIDELNSLLGVVRIVAENTPDMPTRQTTVAAVIERIQQDLFVVQAELADVGEKSNKKITKERVTELEQIIAHIEQDIPAITSFVLSGATALSAQLDYARAVARRAERRVTALTETTSIPAPLQAYLNRLSSLLYALARLAAHTAGKKETPPSYD